MAKPKAKKKTKSKPGAGKKPQESSLVAAIRDLGGNPDEDLELIGQVDQEDQELVDPEAGEEEEVLMSKDGRKELEAFIQKLGLFESAKKSAQIVQDPPGEQDADEDYEDMEDDEEAEAEVRRFSGKITIS